MNKHQILVAIPAYNCEKQIGRVIEGFSSELLKNLAEVIVVDNISSDGTIDGAKKAIQKLGVRKIKVMQNKNNYSLGASHKVAFLYAEKKKYDYVVILHGDDQAKTSDVNDLLELTKSKPELDAVLGCRFMKESQLKGYSLQRIWGNKFLNLIYTLVTFRRTYDLGSGLNIFKVSSLKDHRYLNFGDNLAFNFDLLLDYYKKHSELGYVPISWTEEDQVSNARNFQIAWFAFTKLIRWRIGKERFQPQKASHYVSNQV